MNQPTHALSGRRAPDPYEGHPPGPWHACAGDDCEHLQRGGERLYFPHIHLGPPDHCRTYTSADGSEQPALSDYIVVNQGAPSMAALDAAARLLADAPLLLGQRDRLASALNVAMAEGGHTAECRQANRELWEALTDLPAEERSKVDDSYRCACWMRTAEALLRELGR